MRQRTKIIGVLGGMGPLATADFYTQLVRLTPARTDQDHPRVIIDSNPHIPDRTAGIKGRGADPTAALVATAQALERGGAQFLAIPCNSAHAYLPAIRRSIRIPVLDIMEEVAARAVRLAPRPRRAGVLATSGTLATRLYHRALAARGIEVIEPSAAEEASVESAIKAVKAGDVGPAVRRRVGEAARALIRRGAEAIVLGCTELPLVMGPSDVPVPVLDGTTILAQAAVREALPRRARRRPARGVPRSERRSPRAGKKTSGIIRPPAARAWNFPSGGGVRIP